VQYYAFSIVSFFQIDNSLNNKPKRFNKMFNYILALLFLVKIKVFTCHVLGLTLGLGTVLVDYTLPF